MKGILAAAVICTILLVGIAGWLRVQRFLNRTPPIPAVATPATREVRPPMGNCTLGPLDPMRPPFWSLPMELAVQRVVIEQRFLWTVSRRGLAPIGLPTEIQLDDRVLEYPPGRLEGSQSGWPMNDACREIPALRRSTAASFRRMNRDGGGRVFGWLALPVPIVPKRLPLPERERADFMRIDPDRVGILRLSHVGFSADATQALVAVGRYYAYGWSEASYYLLERRYSTWWIVDEVKIWEV